MCRHQRNQRHLAGARAPKSDTWAAETPPRRHFQAGPVLAAAGPAKLTITGKKRRRREEGQGAMVVNLGPSLTLANVNDVKEALLDSLSAGDAVALDGSTLNEVDVSGLQLLCATQRMASSQKKRVTFTGPVGPGLMLARNNAGFGPDRGCPADCLCNGGQQT
jgi:ABC-type transporter Mla MlaB component